ncbi:hypothetical protein SB763_34915, partial [Burkholderia sp. SIMBA_042]
KWPERAVQSIASTLAGRIVSRRDLQVGFNEQEVSNVLGALSKWPDVPYCTEAALTLIPRIATDPSVVRSFNQQEAVQTLNA